MYKDGTYATDNDRIRVYYNTVASSSGGTLIGTVNRSISLAPAVSAEGCYSFAFDIAGTPTGPEYISIVGTSGYGSNIFIDDVSVSQIATDDAEISSLSIPAITAVQGNTITGNFKNMGSNMITSVDVNWQVDSGAITTETLNNLSVAPGDVAAYASSTIWTASPGSYSLKVWLSNPNGVADTDLSNNELTKQIYIASNSTIRVPLYEKFSSSTCPPCAQFNGSYFSPFYTANNSRFTLISYQVNWPGSGDPYYTLETGTRVAYYNVNGAPSLFVDSKGGTDFNVGQLTTNLNNAEAKQSFFGLTSTHTMV